MSNNKTTYLFFRRSTILLISSRIKRLAGRRSRPPPRPLALHLHTEDLPSIQHPVAKMEGKSCISNPFGLSCLFSVYSCLYIDTIKCSNNKKKFQALINVPE